MACEQQVDFFINQPVLKVFGNLSTMPKIANCKVDYVDYQNFRILLSANASFKSWGEDIILSFFDPMNGGTRIIVQSKPKLATTLFDLGKNKENVDEIQRYIGYIYNNQF